MKFWIFSAARKWRLVFVLIKVLIFFHTSNPNIKLVYRKQSSQTNSRAISTTLLRITRILRIVITVQALGTSLALESSASLWLLGGTDTRLVTSHAAITRCSRVVNAMRALLARRRRLDAEATARLVLVLEVARSGAPVDVFAVGESGFAYGISGAGCDLAPTFLACGLRGCGSEADSSGKEDILEQHVLF
jgi:hypothetical protein